MDQDNNKYPGKNQPKKEKGMLNEEIARVAHEVNRAYCRAIGDPSQPKWEDAPGWQRASAINGVMFHLANPDALPMDSHIEWLREKERDGWRYGPVKNVERKEHPCFVPYDKLPTEEKAKDFIFQAVVHALGDVAETNEGEVEWSKK